jgi:RNA polymerase sigma-70 factor (ECF subfamily)
MAIARPMPEVEPVTTAFSPPSRTRRRYPAERFKALVTWGSMRIVSVTNFDEWYADQRPRVYVSMLALSEDPDLAAEVTDEAFMRAVAHWKRVCAMESPGGWTQRVALNVLRRRLRRRRAEARLLSKLTRHEQEPTPTSEVWHLVGALPERQRIAVVLRYVADLTEPDIAIAMGVARGTVASTLAAARARLAEVLSSEIEEDVQ